MDSNHGPRPYQGRALTKLSYAPETTRDSVILPDKLVFTTGGREFFLVFWAYDTLTPFS